MASDASVASLAVAVEQSKFDLNGDTYSDYYDEIRSRTDSKKASLPSRIQAGCPGHLSIAPRQLADIFSVFHREDKEAEQSKPPVSSIYSQMSPRIRENLDSDAATEVTSNTFTPSVASYNPKVDSLQRECDALKQIINTDSAKLLLLQGQRKRLQEDLEQCKMEKKIMERRVRGLELERQSSLKRQKHQDETVLHLRQELQNAPQDKTYAGASLYDIEELRLANEMLASQVIHAERQLLQRANSDKENEAPPEALQKESSKPDGLLTPEPAQFVLEDISPHILAKQLKSLETRMKAMEEGSLVGSTSREDVDHTDKSVQTMDTEPEDIDFIGLSVPLEGPGVEGVEVCIDGILSVATVEEVDVERGLEMELHQALKLRKEEVAGSGDYFCDCFPTKSHSDED
jgi:K+-transporting ATPase c subunit